MSDEVGRNDTCPCGSGKKYKKCCWLNALSPSEAKARKPLKTRNIELLNGMNDIFDLDRKSWTEVKGDISPSQIKELYELYESLWPKETNIDSILPQPANNLRALYVGLMHPEVILSGVIRYSLYTDEIIVINPLFMPRTVTSEFNPIEHPEKLVQDTLRSVYLLKQLAPLVSLGAVILIPDPGDFDYGLRLETWRLALERVQGSVFDPRKIEDIQSVSIREMNRMHLQSPDETIAYMIKQQDPTITDEEISKMVQSVQRLREEDPLIPHRFDITSGCSQLYAMRTGANLEMGMYISQLTGSYLYTNLKRRWEEILSTSESEVGPWSSLTYAFQQLDFKFLDDVPIKFIHDLRGDGRLESLRAYLRRIWLDLEHVEQSETNDSAIKEKALQYTDELKSEYQKAKAEWSKIDQELASWLYSRAGMGGLISSTLDWKIPAVGFAIEGVGKLISSTSKRSNFRKSTPLSVFVDLEIN